MVIEVSNDVLISLANYQEGYHTESVILIHV